MSVAPPIFLALELPPKVVDHLALIVAGSIVVVGLFVIGFRDLIRFRFRRVWAISGVCFSESIRKRILWITPLAILGVVLIAQLQKPADEQDAIRQTTKFCIFATGLVVTVSTIILACTNLPREIENRVIYTVVTKPTTRLEIVLGKIVGFSRVSAAILIIMGLFTYGYLFLRARVMEGDIQERLKSGTVDAISRPTLEHYGAGLLNAQSLANSPLPGVYSRIPPIGEGRRYFKEGTVLVPFVMPEDVAVLVDAQGKPSDAGMVIQVRMGFDRLKPPASATPSTTAPASTQPAALPQALVQIYDPGQNSLLVQEVNGGKPVTLGSADGTAFQVAIPANYISSLLKIPFFYVALVPGSTDAEYWIDPDAVQVIVPTGDKGEMRTLKPVNPTDPSQPAQFVFSGRQGLDGEQIMGDANPDDAEVGVFPFTGLKIDTGANNSIPMQLRVSIEADGDTTDDTENFTRVNLQARNRKTGKIVEIGEVRPENNRPVYDVIPAEAVEGGDFDVIVRCLTPQHWVGLKPTSLAIVQSQSTFGLNLVKSLFVIWLLTVLVTSISIFSSTFLSWPIAIVLTLLILLGHWGVEQLGDAATAGLGRQFVQDFGVRDPARAQAISATVEQLNKLLTTVSTVLPDIERFSSTEDIERGISLPGYKLWEALLATVSFGVPLTVLAYVFLKNKEVAP